MDAHAHILHLNAHKIPLQNAHKVPMWSGSPAFVLLYFILLR
jgi:hypothetical protein